MQKKSDNRWCKYHRPHKWDHREVIRLSLIGYNTYAIAEELGMPQSTVQRIKDKHGMSGGYTSEEKIEDVMHLHNAGRSSREIAFSLSMGQATVLKILRRKKIEQEKKLRDRGST